MPSRIYNIYCLLLTIIQTKLELGCLCKNSENICIINVYSTNFMHTKIKIIIIIYD
jgi:hypothetical protein